MARVGYFGGNSAHVQRSASDLDVAWLPATPTWTGCEWRSGTVWYYAVRELTVVLYDVVVAVGDGAAAFAMSLPRRASTPTEAVVFARTHGDDAEPQASMCVAIASGEELRFEPAAPLAPGEYALRGQLTLRTDANHRE